MPIDSSVELDDDDLDLFVDLDIRPGRTRETSNRLAYRNLERAGAVKISDLRGWRGLYCITAIVEPEELDL